MAPVQYNALLQSIAHTVADYRAGEIPPITPDHVDRWVSQFDQPDRLVILNEMDRILQRFYVSKTELVQALRGFLQRSEIFGREPAPVLRESHFLDIQLGGQSQHNLIQLLNRITLSDHEINIDHFPENPDCYFYIDDVLFSGNRSYRDIKHWVNSARPHTELHMFFHIAHEKGLNNMEWRVKKLLNEKGIELYIWYDHLINNNDRDTSVYECLWPMLGDNAASIDYDTYIQQQAIETGYSARRFRKSHFDKETIFSSKESRHIVEQSFLKQGLHLISFCDNPKPYMRPMGYEFTYSPGFGALVITYRNIANNCPLVLWWGLPDAPAWHPFSKWYPLFLRSGYEEANF